MNMNPMAIMKLMGAKSKFENAHPKFMAFMKMVISRPMEEGTIIEVTLTRPGEEPITSNLKVTNEDLELLASLKDLGGN